MLIGGLIVLYIAQRDTKASQAEAERTERERTSTEDAALRTTTQTRFAKLAAIRPGTPMPCDNITDDLPVLQQAWLAGIPSLLPLIQTLAFEQLASTRALTPEARGRRAQRIQELAKLPRAILLIVTSATPIVESPGEPGKSRFSAGSLDGQLVIVEVASGSVLCRAPLHVETQAFTSYAATAESSDNSSVILDAWREPYWRAITTSIAYSAKALRE